MGGSDVIVPEGVHVELEGFALLGGNELQARRARRRRPGAPVVRVKAWSLHGRHRRQDADQSRAAATASRTRRPAAASLNGGLRGQEPAARGRSRPRCRPPAAPPAAPAPPGGTRRPGARSAAGRACSRAARPRSAGIASPGSRCCRPRRARLPLRGPGALLLGHRAPGQAAPRRGRPAQAREREAARAARGAARPERARARGAAARDGPPGERPYVLDHLPKGP